MKKTTTFLIWLIPFVAICQAPAPQEIEVDSFVRIADAITPYGIKKHVVLLASDRMEGREAGSEGERKAAEYIATHLKTAGIQPASKQGDYFQIIVFNRHRWDELGMRVNGKEFHDRKDFFSLPDINAHSPHLEVDTVVFLGYGIDDEEYSDYKGRDVRGKTILIYQGNPINKQGRSWIAGKKRVEGNAKLEQKLITAKKHGVKTVIFIEPNLKVQALFYNNRLVNASLKMSRGARQIADLYPNSIYASSDVVKEMLGDYYDEFIEKRDKINNTGKPQSLAVPCDLSLVMKKQNLATSPGINVVGYLPGTDLKDELIIVSAHYDHLGKRGDDIYNGADDNASGTATILEIAKAMGAASQRGMHPRRSVLFIFFSAEEKGLIGSEYYVKFPLFPLKNTVANLNVDMVGRVDNRHKNNPDYVYLISGSPKRSPIHQINKAANDKYIHLKLDYSLNKRGSADSYYYRSDHYNFAEKGIPVLFYFSGEHKDYHRTSDTAEKILYDKTAKIGKLIFHTLWQLSNQDKRIKSSMGW